MERFPILITEAPKKITPKANVVTAIRGCKYTHESIDPLIIVSMPYASTTSMTMLRATLSAGTPNLFTKTVRPARDQIRPGMYRASQLRE